MCPDELYRVLMEERESERERRRREGGRERGRKDRRRREEGRIKGGKQHGGRGGTCCPTKILRAINSPTPPRHDGRGDRWSAQKSRPPLFVRSIFNMLAIRQNVGHRRDEWVFHLRGVRRAYPHFQLPTQVQEQRISGEYGWLH